MVKDWIKSEGFRVMGICQVYHVKGQALWMATNQSVYISFYLFNSFIFLFKFPNFRYRLKGLELKRFRAKTMKKVFERTSFEPLRGVFDDNTFVLYGKEMDSIRSIVKESKRYSWITPLGWSYLAHKITLATFI